MAEAKVSFWMDTFRDYRGQASFGRVAAGYCIVGAVLIIEEAFLIPGTTAYCLSASGSLLLAAGGLYGASKGEQWGSSAAAAKIKALLGVSDAAADAGIAPASPTPSFAQDVR